MELRPLRIYMRPQFVIFVAAGEAGHECPRLHKSPKHSKLMGQYTWHCLSVLVCCKMVVDEL